jgi:hypothetical protein
MHVLKRFRRLFSQRSGEKNGFPIIGQEQFMQSIIRECARADRGNKTLSLISLKFSPQVKQNGFLKKSIQQTTSRLRLTDSIGWLEVDVLGILLPETANAGAWHVLKDILANVNASSLIESYEVYTYPSPKWPFH